jgi:hypothetical protein
LSYTRKVLELLVYRAAFVRHPLAVAEGIPSPRSFVAAKQGDDNRAHTRLRTLEAAAKIATANRLELVDLDEQIGEEMVELRRRLRWKDARRRVIYGLSSLMSARPGAP